MIAIRRTGPLLCAAVFGVGAFLLSVNARAWGGAEVLCNGAVEKWTSIPAGGIPWYMTRDKPGFDRRVAPGYPGLACNFPGPRADRPGVQSVTRAVAAWAEPPLPTGGSGGELDPTQTQGDPDRRSDFFMNDRPNAFLVQDTNLNKEYLNAADPQAFDGKNVITLLEPASSFEDAGGNAALAITEIRRNNVTGRILEADIGINTRANVVGFPLWTFVEYNDTTELWHSTSHTPPLYGYADLQGVVTHEMGHFAGLGHSLVESEYDGSLSRVPTMFPVADAREISEPSWYRPAPGCLNSTPHYILGTIFGESARDLEADDIAAIASAYPSPNFSQDYGTVSGNVMEVDVPRAGAHVIAINDFYPDEVRVGTFTDSNGDYSITGLEEGWYYVYFEAVDIESQPGSTDFGGEFPYFYSDEVPEIVGCSSEREFLPEFWDNLGESRCEAAYGGLAEGARVFVGAGQEVTDIDVIVSIPPSSPASCMTCCTQPIACGSSCTVPEGNIALTIGSTVEGSPRGFNLSQQYPVIPLLVRAEGFAHQPFGIRISPSLSTEITQAGQVVQAGRLTGGDLVEYRFDTLDGNGRRVVYLDITTLTVVPNSLCNLFIQVVFTTDPLLGGEPVIVGNTVNLRIVD